jgi:hypothetical protein
MLTFFIGFRILSKLKCDALYPLAFSYSGLMFTLIFSQKENHIQIRESIWEASLSTWGRILHRGTEAIVWSLP